MNLCIDMLSLFRNRATLVQLLGMRYYTNRMLPP